MTTSTSSSFCAGPVSLGDIAHGAPVAPALPVTRGLPVAPGLPAAPGLPVTSGLPVPRLSVEPGLTVTPGAPAVAGVEAAPGPHAKSVAVPAAEAGAAAALSASALLRLLQLVSPALPIGGYNFSQGLEYAIQADWVRDEKTALAWISGLMHSSIGTLDIAVLQRMHGAWSSADTAGITHWSRFLIASRETAELRAEDRHLGRSLAKVLAEAGIADAREWMTRTDATFATLFALGCTRWGIGKAECAWGYLWTWAENQTLAAVKAVPLGQSAGQRMLDTLIAQIAAVAAKASSLSDEQIGTAAPMHFIASAAHETQYTRLFRS